MTSTTSTYSLLTFQDVAKVLIVSRSTIERLVKTRQLCAVKLGHGDKAPVRFRREDVDAFIESNLTFNTELSECSGDALGSGISAKRHSHRRMVITGPSIRRRPVGKSLMERLI
jgi:excisionase family DNA binding protein